MGDYRLIARQRARRPALFSAEGAQWPQYRQPLTLSLKAAPRHVEFSPVSPHDVRRRLSSRCTPRASRRTGRSCTRRRTTPPPSAGMWWRGSPEVVVVVEELVQRNA
ncbi:hypothetical protein AB1Y20_014780 [Prymnesium parvum]|uniref:Uncharacterized protein n=1 Tax=Prymnesium parvum TaxID=97485 RepID=A0AB34IEB7_PRYPA